jgi:polysaccharide deacetylase 2 family uncharacterized protein YibQ
MKDEQEEYSDFVDDEDDSAPFTDASVPAPRGIRVRAWIAGILAIVATFIFVADRFFVLVKPNIDRARSRRQTAALGEFERELHRVLGDYGILDAWIKTHQLTVADGALLRDEWLIAIPRDIAVASINFDIKTALEPYDALTFAVENAKTRQVTIHIRIGAQVRYSLLFTPSDNLKRMAGRLMFMVDRLGNAPSSELEALIGNRDPIICCITPSRDIMPVFDKVRLAQKEVVLHLHIAAKKGDPAQFALSEGHSEAEVRRKIRLAAKTFQGAKAFFITTDVTPSVAAGIAESELVLAGLRKIDPATLSYLDRIQESGGMASRVNDVSNEAIKHGIGIGVVELEDGVVAFLASEMSRLRKRGFIFIKPSHM